MPLFKGLAYQKISSSAGSSEKFSVETLTCATSAQFNFPKKKPTKNWRWADKFFPETFCHSLLISSSSSLLTSNHITRILAQHTHGDWKERNRNYWQNLKVKTSHCFVQFHGEGSRGGSSAKTGRARRCLLGSWFTSQGI